jgi:hypothetical protein
MVDETGTGLGRSIQQGGDSRGSLSAGRLEQVPAMAEHERHRRVAERGRDFKSRPPRVE